MENLKKTMFDARNKGQPKLVYSHGGSSHAEQSQREVEIKIVPAATSANPVKEEQQLQQSAPPIPPRVRLQIPPEQQRQAPSSPKSPTQQRQNIQKLLQHQESLKRQKHHLEQQQQQKLWQQKLAPTPPPSSPLQSHQFLPQSTAQQPQPQSPSLRHKHHQHPPPSPQPQQHTVTGVISTSKASDTSQQNGFVRSSSPRPPDKVTSNGPQLITTDTDINNRAEKMEEFRLYRGRVHEVHTDKPLTPDGTVVRSAASSASSSVEIGKQQVVTTAAGTHKVVVNQSSVPNQGTQGKPSKTNGTVTLVSKPTHGQVQHPSYQGLQQQYMYPGNHHPHQQNQHQFQQQQQQQQIFRDHQKQIQESRGNGFRVQGHSHGRQPPSPSFPASGSKNGHAVTAWSIPRVTATTSGSTRPHSMPLPLSGRAHEIISNGAPQRHSGNEIMSGSLKPRVEFVNHDPSKENSSPRTASRSSYKVDQNAHSKPSSANPPKSILKNNLSLEQSDLYYSSRPLLLPRAHSENGPSHSAREFDFSSILTAKKDPLSTTKAPSIKVQGQMPGQPVPPNASPSFRTKRPNTAGPAMTNYELNQDGQSQRKCVTFNTQVRLHLDDRVSTVKSLAVDA